jgi:hypothetical protein
MDEHARNAGNRSAAAYESAHQILDMIPAGQPILVGHHSEGRHRRALNRADSAMRRSWNEDDKAEHFAHRAEVAENVKAARENVPTTLRRIAKLEADERRIDRGISGRLEYRHDDDGCPRQGTWHVHLVKPSEKQRTELDRRKAEVADELAYWRDIIAKAEAAGTKIWTRADFAKGDFVLRHHDQWAEVLRVNAKSLTVPALLDMRPVATENGQPYPWTDTLPYDEVRGRKSAAEIADLSPAQDTGAGDGDGTRPDA